MILHLTNDLMLSSSARQIADELGLELSLARTVDGLIDIIKSQPVSLLLVDLQLPGFSIDEFSARFQSLPVRPRTVAYAQHVNIELLEQAAQADFDSVLTRGQFNRDLAKILNATGDSVS